MKLSPELRGRRVRKAHWGADEWWYIIFVGIHIVVVKDQHGKEQTLERDYMDKDYELIPEKPKGEEIEVHDGPETTPNGKYVEDNS